MLLMPRQSRLSAIHGAVRRVASLSTRSAFVVNTRLQPPRFATSRPPVANSCRPDRTAIMVLRISASRSMALQPRLLRTRHAAPCSGKRVETIG